MVPGSTFRYGSSFWRETVRWRAFRMFPIDAAVMPLPSEETTPPVTKTYFDIDDLQGGFSNVTGEGRRLNLWLRFRLQDDHLGLVLGDRGLLYGQLRLRLGCGHPHLFEKPVEGLELQLEAGNCVVHRHHVARLELPDDLGRLGGVDRRAAADRNEQHVRRCDGLSLGVFELVPQVAEMADPNVVDFYQVHRVPPVSGAFVTVMEGRDADHAYAGHFIFAGTTDLVSAIAHHLRVI